MNVGDVVFINEERGCWDPPQRVAMGYGVVLAVEPQETFLLLGKYPHKPNDILEVMLDCGKVQRFDAGDAEVVDEKAC